LLGWLSTDLVGLLELRLDFDPVLLRVGLVEVLEPSDWEVLSFGADDAELSDGVDVSLGVWSVGVLRPEGTEVDCLDLAGEPLPTGGVDASPLPVAAMETPEPSDGIDILLGGASPVGAVLPRSSDVALLSVDRRGILRSDNNFVEMVGLPGCTGVASLGVDPVGVLKLPNVVASDPLDPVGELFSPRGVDATLFFVIAWEGPDWSTGVGTLDTTNSVVVAGLLCGTDVTLLGFNAVEVLKLSNMATSVSLVPVGELFSLSGADTSLSAVWEGLEWSTGVGILDTTNSVVMMGLSCGTDAPSADSNPVRVLKLSNVVASDPLVPAEELFSSVFTWARALEPEGEIDVPLRDCLSKVPEFSCQIDSVSLGNRPVVVPPSMEVAEISLNGDLVMVGSSNVVVVTSFGDDPTEFVESSEWFDVLLGAGTSGLAEVLCSWRRVGVVSPLNCLVAALGLPDGIGAASHGVDSVGVLRPCDGVGAVSVGVSGALGKEGIAPPDSVVVPMSVRSPFSPCPVRTVTDSVLSVVRTIARPSQNQRQIPQNGITNLLFC